MATRKKISNTEEKSVRKLEPKVFIVNETYVVKRPTSKEIGAYATFIAEYGKTSKKRKSCGLPFTPTVRAEPHMLLIPAVKMCPCLICEEAQYNTLCARRTICTALAYFGHISVKNKSFEDAGCAKLLEKLRS